MSYCGARNSLSSPRYAADKTRRSPTKSPTGAQARNFSKSFWAKIGKKIQNFFTKMMFFDVPKGLEASKPQNWPPRPPTRV